MDGKTCVSQLFDDVTKLHRLLSLTHSRDDPLDQKEADDLKSSRSHLLGSKKGIFFEAMTLFPVGVHISSSAAEGCASFYRDQGFGKDLDDLISVVDGFKPFTADSLIKKTTNAATGKEDFDVQIPVQAKVFDVTSRCLLFPCSAMVSSCFGHSCFGVSAQQV